MCTQSCWMPHLDAVNDIDRADEGALRICRRKHWRVAFFPMDSSVEIFQALQQSCRKHQGKHITGALAYCARRSEPRVSRGSTAATERKALA